MNNQKSKFKEFKKYLKCGSLQAVSGGKGGSQDLKSEQITKGRQLYPEYFRESSLANVGVGQYESINAHPRLVACM